MEHDASEPAGSPSPTPTPPQAPVGSPTPSAASPEPRLVQRVVCGYRLGSLPGDWLQVWRRLDRGLQRAGLDVKATLAPLEELPEDTDILVVAPDMREAALRVARPGMPLLVTSPAGAHAAFEDLVRRLSEGVHLTARRVDPAAAEGPKIVTYRGSTRLD